VIRCEVRSAPQRRVLAGAIVAVVATIWLVASPSAFAQLSFSSTDFPISGVMPEAVVASDFNGDGHLDLATANQGLPASEGGVEVLLGDGTGSFADKDQYSANDNPISLDIGDFNADSHVDLAVANHTSGDVSVLLGAGDGSFGAPTNYAVGGGCTSTNLIFPEAVVVGFFNADAHPDLAVANFGCNSVSILLGKGDGTFAAATDIDVGEGPDALATGEFNGDLNLDLVVPLTGDQAGSAAVLLGQGDGTFVSTSQGAPAGPVSLFVEVAVGDFNGDTKADLVFASGDPLAGGLISVALGQGDGTFASPTNSSFGDATSSVAVADFNADSVVDVATTDNLSPAVWVLLGVGNGTLMSPRSFAASSPNWVTVGNFNTDPLPDMATADPDLNDARVTVLLNTTPPPSPAPTVSVAAGGSCTPNGRQGTIELALGEAEEPASGLSLSVTSSDHAVVPTRDITFGGSGASRELTVRPAAGRRGTAVVTVNRLSDGQVTGLVPVTVHAAGNGASRVVGGPGADVAFGQGGSDRLAGLGGNDLLCGGNGADKLLGGEHDDSLHGGRGRDRLAGGPGADRFNGGPGKDLATDFDPAEGDTQDGTMP
jgi:Ca2+-binding RTX toxin-like protein